MSKASDRYAPRPLALCECGECARCKARAYQKAYRARTPLTAEHLKRIAANKRARKVKLRTFVETFKSEHGCAFCDEHDPVALDFDHREGESKLDTISKLVQSAAAMRVLMAEIKKCDLVCANCHRKRHAGRVLERRRPILRVVA